MVGGEGNFNITPDGGQAGNSLPPPSTGPGQTTIEEGPPAPGGPRNIRPISPTPASGGVASGSAVGSISGGSSTIQTGSTEIPVSAPSAPQQDSLPPASIPAASTGGGIGGGASASGGISNAPAGMTDSNQGSHPPGSGNPDLPGRPLITPIPPVVVPPQVAVTGATGGGVTATAAPGVSASGLPSAGGSINPVGGSSPPVPPSGGQIYDPPLSNPSSSNSALPRESSASGSVNSGGSHGGRLPPLLPVVPVTAAGRSTGGGSTGGGSTGGGVPGAVPPPIPSGGPESDGKGKSR